VTHPTEAAATASGDPTRERGRYWLLFGASIGLLALSPLIPPGPLTGMGRDGLLAIVFIGGMRAIWHRTRTGTALVSLVGVALLATIASRATELGAADMLADVLGFVALGAIGVAILHDVLRSERVSTDTLFAAGCIYLVLGLWAGKLHLLLEMAAPGSYELGLPAGASIDDVDQALTYFSFVTLTTTGYGDVLPLTPAARSFASVEALMGQLYVAILIARLVGLHMRGDHGREEGKSDDG